MDFYSPICRNIFIPLLRLRKKSVYLQHFKYFSQHQYDPIDILQARQFEKLKTILQHAYDNVTYYRNKWQEIDFHPHDLKSLNDLEKLPLLTKEDIRQNKEDLVAANTLPSPLVPRKTSGSTGVSLEFYVDDDCQQIKAGYALMRDHWSGWRLGEKIASIWGNPTHRVNLKARLRNLLLERFDYLDTLKMGEKDMLEFYNRQVDRKPSLLFGHAHSLYLFAMFLKNKGHIPFPVKGIISTCMVLHQHERELIEEVFESRITNRYGCEEVSLIASECEQHSGMHLNIDNLVVEFVRDGKPVPAGEPGAIVVTDLINRGMPFIRYKVGDVGIPSERKCSCGRASPLMENVEGRIADYVVTPEGNYISGISLTENFAMHLPEVKQMQIIQEEIDTLLFRIVKGENFTDAAEEKIARLAEERFGKSMKHSIKYVDHIPQEVSGKYRFCISNIGDPFF